LSATEEKAKVTRRGYVKYVGGIVVVAVVAAAGYGIYEATKPAPTTPTPTPTPTPITKPPAPPIPTIPQVEVRYMNLPYVDHTYSIIAMQKGWFSDVGIKIVPEPYGDVGTTCEDIVRALVSGTNPIVTGSDVAILPSIPKNPNLRGLGYIDMFQGYGIMADPKLKLKSFKEFVAEGIEPAEAFKATMAQIKGKRFVFSAADSALKGFVDLALMKGGITMGDFEYIDAADAKGVELMLGGHADIEVGGAPYHVALLREGFTEILTSLDLAAYAKASPDSVELRGIFPDGWVTTIDFWNANHDTCLRFSSAMYRISRFIVERPDEALAIHIPFANSITGMKMTTEEGKIIYDKLDPFYTFEFQKKMFTDKSWPLYYAHILGSYIKMWEESGLFPAGKYKPDDVTLARIMYEEMEALRDDAGSLLAEAGTLIDQGKSQGKDVSAATLLVDRAKFFYDAYDYLDAKRFAASAKDHAEYALKYG